MKQQETDDIIKRYIEILDGMYQRTNYKKRAINKQTYKGGYNQALDDSIGILKIVLGKSTEEVL